MLNSCKIHRLACFILPSFSIFTIVLLSLTQHRLYTGKPAVCKPCNCQVSKLLGYVVESTSQEIPSSSTNTNPCQCPPRKVPLLSDVRLDNLSDFEAVPQCALCLPEHIPIDVNINKREKITALYNKQDQSIHIPFDFIKKRYELYSEFKAPSKKSSGSLLWLPTNLRESDVSNYETFGPYMNSENLTVEARERVKLISAPDGVPVSTQWNEHGYYYPTQIAQFGLAHYSKLLRFPGPVVYSLEDGYLNVSHRWQKPKGATMRSVNDKAVGSRVVFFDSRGIHEDGITFPVPTEEGKMRVLSLSVKFRTAGQFSVTVLGSNGKQYIIHYSVRETMWVKYSYPEIFYGLRKRNKWFHLTRDLNVDLQKGLGCTSKRKVKSVSTTVIQVIQFTFHGTGWFDNVTLSSSAHERSFLTAASWFVKRQDIRGGWPINVTRKVVSGLQIQPGWYSAMSQGQAISLLCRAYNHTSNPLFLKAALSALNIFRRPSSEPGGIVAKFMDKHVWYEEYPTQPPMFILNGFMYALIGLYDMAVLAKGTAGGDEAQSLLDDGLASLDAMLPLFDNGFGTFYDLKHATMKDNVRPPNRARWSYHVLHVEQLAVIRQFHPSSAIDVILERWRSYLRGYVSPHN